MLDRHESESAEANFRQAIAIVEPLTRQHREETHYYRHALGRYHDRLGLALLRQGRLADAEAEHGRAIALLRQVVTDQPGKPDYVGTLGGSLCNLGRVLAREGRLEGAVELYGQAIETLAPVVPKDGKQALTRKFLRNSHYGRADALTRLERFPDAMPDWDRVLQLDAGEDRTFLRMFRASCLAHIEPEKAVAEAEDLVKDDKVHPAVIYGAATVCAVASATVKDAAKRERYAARAVALLGPAGARGNFRNKSDLQLLKSDPTLHPLHQRDNFKKLLKGLEEKH